RRRWRRLWRVSRRRWWRWRRQKSRQQARLQRRAWRQGDDGKELEGGDGGGEPSQECGGPLLRVQSPGDAGAQGRHAAVRLEAGGGVAGLLGCCELWEVRRAVPEAGRQAPAHGRV
ncbi:unnamed protein product, partial [Effrenium voratum]